MTNNETPDTLESKIHKLTGPDAEIPSNQDQMNLIQEIKHTFSREGASVFRRINEMEENLVERIDTLRKTHHDLNIFKVSERNQGVKLDDVPDDRIAVTGRVRTEENDQPLAGAKVQLGEKRAEGSVDSKGYFTVILPRDQFDKEMDLQVKWEDSEFEPEDVSFGIAKKGNQLAEMDVQIPVEDTEKVKQVQKEKEESEADESTSVPDPDKLRENLSEETNVLNHPLSTFKRVFKRKQKDKT